MYFLPSVEQKDSLLDPVMSWVNLSTFSRPVSGISTSILSINLRPYFSSNPLLQLLITTFYSLFNPFRFSWYGSPISRKYLTNSTTIRFSRNYLVKHKHEFSQVLNFFTYTIVCQSQLPRPLRCGTAGTCLLGLRVWFPPEACISVSYECCVLSGRVVCTWLIINTE
jgi:hypothetical protein